METSPLAALHRPVPVPGWAGRDLFGSHPHAHFSEASTGSRNLSLRERLHKNTADFFNVNELRGNSPAASLAADLSQNFRLDNDASPRFPTPRRALFTSNVRSGMEKRGYTTTPPLPSSSPAPGNGSMDVSPLPNKSHFFGQIEVTSPTPGSTPVAEDEVMLDSSAPISRQPSLEPPNSILADLKRAVPRRPSLTRTKGLSTSAVPRSQAEGLSPSLRLHSQSTNNLSLGECFDSPSPPQERRLPQANCQYSPIPLSLRAGARHGSLSSAHRNGSPMNHHGRRTANPFLRNRKQFRRSLSMFENPADVVKPKSESAGEPVPSSLQKVMDADESADPTLPHFLTDDPTDTIPRISKETLVDVLDGRYSDHFDQKMVIDCRFEYEYDGGHINGAVNYNDKELLAKQLFETPMEGKALLIFHCEYSAHRAPLMARHIRSEDRTVNAEHYPRLTYPEVYILDGGYSTFFSEHRGRCDPQNYVEMSDEKHQRTCEREMGRLKARKGLGRAQTFAFGQRQTSVDDSPTACSRDLSSHDVIGNSPVQSTGERSFTRRMASY